MPSLLPSITPLFLTHSRENFFISQGEINSPEFSFVYSLLRRRRYFKNFLIMAGFRGGHIQPQIESAMDGEGEGAMKGKTKNSYEKNAVSLYARKEVEFACPCSAPAGFLLISTTILYKHRK